MTTGNKSLEQIIFGELRGPPQLPGVQPITVPKIITTPTGWQMTPDYGTFVSPQGEQFTLAEMQTRLPELGFEGVVYDWTKDLFVPATAEQVAQRQQVYATMTTQLAEITPTPPKWGEPGFFERDFAAEVLEKLRKVGEPGTPGAISIEEYETRIAEYNTMLTEQRTKIESAFQVVFPGTTLEDFQQVLTAMTVTDYMTETEKAEVDRVQTEFLTSIQQIGRTPETEFLLQTIFPSATPQDINEIFGIVPRGEVLPVITKVTEKEAKDIYDQKMVDIYNKYPKAPYTKEQMKSDWYQAMWKEKQQAWDEYQARLPGIEESIYTKIMNAVNWPIELIGAAMWGMFTGAGGKEELEVTALVKKYKTGEINKAEFNKQAAELAPKLEKVKQEYEALPFWQQFIWESPAFLDIYKTGFKLLSEGAVKASLNLGLDKWIATQARLAS